MALVSKIFRALGRTRATLSSAVTSIIRKRITDESLESLEEVLLSADLGFKTVDLFIEELRKNSRTDLSQKVYTILTDLLPAQKNIPALSSEPTVLMVVGVNGTGKTTSVAKMAAHYRKQGRKILLIGADTYRAAAVEQLNIWSKRLGVRLICNEKSADPSSVLFDGMNAAKAGNYDLVLVDTAGRLHTYDNLMGELDKMYTVISKHFSSWGVLSYICIDSTLGQNSVQQAKKFAEHVQINAAILTKLDGTAKGGIVFPLYQELHIPTAFIGVGEQLDDLYPFDAGDYVESLIGLSDD